MKDGNRMLGLSDSLITPLSCKGARYGKLGKFLDKFQVILLGALIGVCFAQGHYSEMGIWSCALCLKMESLYWKNEAESKADMVDDLMNGTLRKSRDRRFGKNGEQ